MEHAETFSEPKPHWSLDGAWGWFVALGLGMVLLGFFAAANLALATVATVIYVSAMMIVAGGLHLVHAFAVRRWRWFIFWFLAGLLYLGAGAAILFDPLLAASIMTMLLAILLGAAGLARTWIAFNEPARGRGWLIASGLLTIAAAVVIAAGWPMNSFWVLGLVLSIDLIFQGTALLFFGLALRSAART